MSEHWFWSDKMCGYDLGKLNVILQIHYKLFLVFRLQYFLFHQISTEWHCSTEQDVTV